MGTQKNCLNETVLLSTQTHVQTDGKENNYNFTINGLCVLLSNVSCLHKSCLCMFLISQLNHVVDAQKNRLNEMGYFEYPKHMLKLMGKKELQFYSHWTLWLTFSNVSSASINLVSVCFLFLNQNICCGYSKEPSQ